MSLSTVREKVMGVTRERRACPMRNQPETPDLPYTYPDQDEAERYPIPPLEGEPQDEDPETALRIDGSR